MPRTTFPRRAGRPVQPWPGSWLHSVAELPYGALQIRQVGAVAIELDGRGATGQVHPRAGDTRAGGELPFHATGAIAAGHAADGNLDGLKAHTLMMQRRAGARRG